MFPRPTEFGNFTAGFRRINRESKNEKKNQNHPKNKNLSDNCRAVSAHRSVLRRQSSKLATVPKSVAAPDVPMANPTPFATLKGPTAWPLSRVSCSRPDAAAKISVRSTATGMSRRWRRSRVPVARVERYMAIAPIQSAAAGFTPRDVFITQGADIFKFSGGIVTPFATVGCPGSDHTSLTFDHEGTFENKMIVTCENGPVFKIDGTGIVQFVAIVPGGFLEGPAVVPAKLRSLGRSDPGGRRCQRSGPRNQERWHRYSKCLPLAGGCGKRQCDPVGALRSPAGRRLLPGGI